MDDELVEVGETSDSGITVLEKYLDANEEDAGNEVDEGDDAEEKEEAEDEDKVEEDADFDAVVGVEEAGLLVLWVVLDSRAELIVA